MSAFTDFVIERAPLGRLESIGWSVWQRVEIAPGEPKAERNGYGKVVLQQRPRNALARLNPALLAEALDDTSCKRARQQHGRCGVPSRRRSSVVSKNAQRHE